MNLKDLAKNRSHLTQKTRDFFTNNNFIEVETPILTTIPGMEPHLNPFQTYFFNNERTRRRMFFNHSPELQMKKLLGSPDGFTNIFTLSKVFRNGEIGGNHHNPEFTMLEWYRKEADYTDIMKDCENLITNLAGNSISYQGHTIDLTPPWPRLSVNDAFQKYLHIDLLQNQDLETFKETATQDNLCTAQTDDTWDDIFFKIFLNHIEKHLGLSQPTILYDYPASQAALAKKSQNQPFLAERFELYIAGIELANAFSELTDANEQRQRLQEEQALRRKLNKTVFDIDEEFLASLESIQSPCAGIALGVDRLFMLLLDQTSIENVLLFPLSKMINPPT